MNPGSKTKIAPITKNKMQNLLTTAGLVRDSPLMRTSSTGAALCETMAEFVGEQGLKEAGDEQLSLIYSMLMSVDG